MVALFAVATRVIGLTGGIGSGKSTVAAMLAELGAERIDADAIARELVEPGQPALAEIERAFGREVLEPDGRLDRKKLAARVFTDAPARARLNAILHPRIAIETARRIGEARARDAKVVVYEAALLVENGIHRALDGLIVVSAPPEAQVARAVARDGMSEAEARARVSAQAPLEAKLAAATWVVDNGGSREATLAQVAALWPKLGGEAR